MALKCANFFTLPDKVRKNRDFEEINFEKIKKILLRQYWKQWRCGKTSFDRKTKLSTKTKKSGKYSTHSF